MKGIAGLLTATGLGIAGAVCNWLYIERAAQVQDQVSFIGVRNDVQLNLGDFLKDDVLVPVAIPRKHVGNLEKTCPPWSAKDAYVGQQVNRLILGGEILLEQDLRTISQRELSKDLLINEVARWVPIDPRTVVSEQINPGDRVSFEVARWKDPEPPVAVLPAKLPLTKTPPGAKAAPAEEEVEDQPLPPPKPVESPKLTEIIGPFRVLALGSRRESPDIARAGRGRVGAESTVTISVRLDGDQLEPKAARLFEAIRRSGGAGASVLLHSARKDK